MNRLNKIRAAVIIASALFLSLVSLNSAWSGSAQDNLGVTASITANCTISTSTVAFGAYDPIVTNASTDLTGTGTVTVTCTNGATSLTIALGLGTNATGSTRRMIAGAGEYLIYELYQEVGHTNIWGTAANAKSVSDGTGLAQAYTVYGVVPAGQNSVVGSYSDTVVATVNF